MAVTVSTSNSGNKILKLAPYPLIGKFPHQHEVVPAEREQNYIVIGRKHH